MEGFFSKSLLKAVLVAEGGLLYLFISVRVLTCLFFGWFFSPLVLLHRPAGILTQVTQAHAGGSPTPDEVEEPVAVASVGFTQYASENIFVTPTRSTPLPALW